ncbi:MAG TPA: hypothetical protein VG943_18370 [Caulobacterales bacterium]|nr:hypothetical protein [Caulobacterales bacterium]
MTREELADDLAYVRTLADEGRHAPLIGGGFLVLFGVLLAFSYFAQWALLTEAFGRAPAYAFAALWIIYGIIATFGSIAIGRRVVKLPGASSIVNRVDRTVWRGASLGIGVVVIGTILRTPQDPLAPNAIMAAAFTLFGVALGATAVIAGKTWLRWVSLLSFVVSVVLWLFLNEPWAYLLAAIASVVVLLGPGVVLMRQEPRATV